MGDKKNKKGNQSKKELLFLSILFSVAVNFDLLIIISMRFENATV